MVTLRAKYLQGNYDIKIAEEATMEDLANNLYQLTGVPVSGQKLICQGKQLVKDASTTVKEAGLKTGSKIMVLGKKFDPEGDAAYKEVVGVETKLIEAEGRLAGLEGEVQGITAGHLDRALHGEALKKIQKRLRGSSEELMRMMESLDSISLTEDQQECRTKRKAVIQRINRTMDRNDCLLHKVADLIKNGVV